MKVRIFDDKRSLGAAAAAAGAEKLRAAIARKGAADIILATGASQFEMLSSLLAEPGINWNAVSIFHLDEYIGLPVDHPAGFRRYLWERFVSKLPVPPAAFYPVNGSAADPERECERLGKILAEHPVDVAFIGIGENGHIAFNDPPADFETEKPYLIITLDEKCRRQQLGEGWFPSLDEAGDFDGRPPDSEECGDHQYGAGPAQGRSGEGGARRGGHEPLSRVDPAHARGCDDLPRPRLRFAAGEDACVIRAGSIFRSTAVPASIFRVRS